MDPITLYKLMILYLLKAVRYPLTQAQLSDFFLTKEYCSYFTFQQVVSELSESHLVRDESARGFTRLVMTREGEETLNYFQKQIPDEIIKDMDGFLDANMIRLRDEVGVTAEKSENGNGEYVALLEIREGKDALVKIELTVPSSEQADIICSNWKNANKEVYEEIMKKLLHD